MKLSRNAKIALAGASILGVYAAYKYYAQGGANAKENGQGSLGGTDDLLGQQGFDIDPNQYTGEYYPRGTGATNPATQEPTPSPAPSGDSDGNGISDIDEQPNNPSGQERYGYAGSLRDNIIGGAAWGAAGIAATGGIAYTAKKLNEFYKARQIGEVDSINPKDAAGFKDKINTEGKLNTKEKARLAGEEFRTNDIKPKSEGLKERFKGFKEEVRIKSKSPAGEAGKVAGTAFLAAQIGSNIYGEVRNKPFGNPFSNDPVKVKQYQDFTKSYGYGAYKIVPETAGFLSGLVYTPKILNKAVAEKDAMPTGFFTTEKGVVQGVKNIGSAFTEGDSLRDKAVSGYSELFRTVGLGAIPQMREDLGNKSDKTKRFSDLKIGDTFGKNNDLLIIRTNNEAYLKVAREGGVEDYGARASMLTTSSITKKVGASSTPVSMSSVSSSSSASKTSSSSSSSKSSSSVSRQSSPSAVSSQLNYSPNISTKSSVSATSAARTGGASTVSTVTKTVNSAANTASSISKSVTSNVRSAASSAVNTIKSITKSKKKK